MKNACLLALALLLAGCATFVPTAPSFSTQSAINGRFAYEHHPDALTGDFTFRKGPTRQIELQVYKGGAVPLFTVTRIDGTWYFSSGIDTRRWSGQPDEAPDLIRNWISATMALEASDSLPPGSHEVQTHLWQGLLEKSNGQLRNMTLRTDAGGTLRFKVSN